MTLNIHKESHIMMMSILLAGAAKTMVVSILSEKVMLMVLVMLAEWHRQNQQTLLMTNSLPKSAQSWKQSLGMSQKNWTN
tara:strand:- start:70 stop:309 length:240 start_codon:yes stop_codon:yes gene_type:complete